jgi:hypothetical protein
MAFVPTGSIGPATQYPAGTEYVWPATLKVKGVSGGTPEPATLQILSRPSSVWLVGAADAVAGALYPPSSSSVSMVLDDQNIADNAYLARRAADRDINIRSTRFDLPRHESRSRGRTITAIRHPVLVKGSIEYCRLRRKRKDVERARQQSGSEVNDEINNEEACFPRGVLTRGWIRWTGRQAVRVHRPPSASEKRGGAVPGSPACPATTKQSSSGCPCGRREAPTVSSRSANRYYAPLFEPAAQAILAALHRGPLPGRHHPLGVDGCHLDEGAPGAPVTVAW